jgi:hypothetical protein
MVQLFTEVPVCLGKYTGTFFFVRVQTVQGGTSMVQGKNTTLNHA